MNNNPFLIFLAVLAALMLDAAVTFRDGIGVDDLTWFANMPTGYGWALVTCGFNSTATTQSTSVTQPTGTTLRADAIQWQVAASPGLADAYTYAVETDVPDPGNDPAVITDAAILAAVTALLPAAE